MQPNSKKAFVLATVVHLAFAVLVLLFTIWSPPERKKEPVVLTLHAPPAALQPEPEVENVSFNYDPPAPAPLPPPLPPKEMPKPTPTPEPKPTPKPEPKPEPPPPEKVNFEDFQKQNPRQRKPEPRPSPRPAPITAPRIDTTKITKTLESMMSRETAAQVSQQSPSNQAALTAYFDRVRAAVRGAWAKPDGLHDRLVATISFNVSADGRISGARIASSSGNSIYDQSVLAAFNRAGSVGPTPDGKSYPLRLEFRMTD